MKKVIVLAGLCCLLAACGSKKRTVSESKTDRSVSTTKRPTSVYNTSPNLSSIEVDKNALFPMPEDSGKFRTFNISTTQQYIETFAQIAQYEMKAFGIPASITLAQGILESGSGKGELTQKTNNHFGIKCHSSWNGSYELHDDDAKDECFRKYNHPMYSFRDHSIFLASRTRYKELFNFRRDDYKRWAKGLKTAGYATDRSYPQKLITLIERYQLHKYDREVLKDGLPAIREQGPYEVFGHEVRQGDTLYAISKQYNVSVEEIKRQNNLIDSLIRVGQVLKIRREVSK